MDTGDEFHDEASTTSEPPKEEKEETPFSVRFSDSRSIADYCTEEGDIPEKYDQIFVNGVIKDDNPEYQRFRKQLQRTDRRWKDVVFQDDACNDSSTPDLLSTVIACFGKVDYFHFWGYIDNIALISCINTGLAMKNGIKGIYICNFDLFTDEEVRLFARGLAFADNLEYLSLDLDDYFHDSEHAPIHADALIEALESNETLQELQLVSWIFPEDTMSELVSRLQTCQLREFELKKTDLSSPLAQDSIRRWLADENCQLECLKLHHCDSEDTPKPAYYDFVKLDSPNTSLTHLQLGDMDITSSSLPLLLENYVNVVSLDLRQNKISDLEPFLPLLLSDQCKLESLMVSGNPITPESVRSFAKMLPHIKGLKNLELTIADDDQGTLKILAEAVIQNTSLERFQVVSYKCDPYKYTPRSDLEEDVETDENENEAEESISPVEPFLLPTLEPDVVNRLNHTLCLNRAGRRHTRCNPSSLPLNLLPHAMCRAMKSRYYKVDTEQAEDEWGYYPTLRSGGLDATFWMLRENSAFLSQRI